MHQARSALLSLPSSCKIMEVHRPRRPFQEECSFPNPSVSSMAIEKRVLNLPTNCRCMGITQTGPEQAGVLLASSWT